MRDHRRHGSAQTYETTIYNRDSGQAFTFVTVPGRSFADGIAAPNAAEFARRLDLREPRFGDGEAIRLAPVEAWSLPFMVDAVLGRPLDDFVWPYEPYFMERYLQGRSRRRAGPSEFAQYLTYSPVVPFESSPLGQKALSDLATAGGGVGVAVGVYTTGDPLLLLVVPAGMIVCGAASGIADALRIGLRAKLLDLMGVDDPALPPDAPPTGEQP